MTAPIVEAVDQAAEETVEIVDDIDIGEMRVRFPVLVIEGADTSDGRFIEADALTHRALPLSLLAQAESPHGGDDVGPAVVVGRLDSLERLPGSQVVSKRTGEPFPDDVFVWTATGAVDTTAQVAGRNVADMIRRGYLRGVSVDLVGMDYDILGMPMSDDDPGLPVDPDNPRRELVTHAAEIAAATLVPIPAFGDAYVELDSGDTAAEPVTVEELPEGLLASAVPAWRSAEVGDLVPVLTAAAEDGLPVRIPPDAVEQITAVIDTGEERDAAALATAIVEHIATGWAATEPIEEDELATPDEDAVVAALAMETAGGFPEEPQPCQYGPEPAVESLVFRDGDAYVPTCADHRQQARDELEAAGETIDEIVPIGAPAEEEEPMPAEAVTAAADGPHTGGMIALIPADPAALAVDGGDPAEQLHLTLAYLGEDVTGWDEERRARTLAEVQSAAALIDGPIEARVFGHAIFNPDGYQDRDPATVYLVGETPPTVTDLRARTMVLADVDQHEPFAPHVTAGYNVPIEALAFTGPVVFDTLRVALGEDVTDIPLGEPADVEEEPVRDPKGIVAAAAAPTEQADQPTKERVVTAAVANRPPAVLVSAANASPDVYLDEVPSDEGRKRPPLAWFTEPGFTEETPITIDGQRVYGHLAPWNRSHLSFSGKNIYAPRSRCDYSEFLRGAVKTTDEDGLTRIVAIGHITAGGPHADMHMSAADTARFYDHSGYSVARVAVGEDQHGIWCAGILNPGATDAQIDALLAHPPSGDWRQVAGHLEMVGVLCVNVPGFGTNRARVASGAPLALVASAGLPPVRVLDSAIDVRALAAAVVDEQERRAVALAAAGLIEDLDDTAVRHTALVAELDDTPAVVAALLAEVDDSPQRAAALLADLDELESFLSGMPPQLKAEWLGGEIAARIAYGTPGQFARCQAIAREKGVPGAQIDGMCADLIREATGKEPGEHD